MCLEIAAILGPYCYISTEVDSPLRPHQSISHISFCPPSSSSRGRTFSSLIGKWFCRFTWADLDSAFQVYWIWFFLWFRSVQVYFRNNLVRCYLAAFIVLLKSDFLLLHATLHRQEDNGREAAKLVTSFLRLDLRERVKMTKSEPSMQLDAWNLKRAELYEVFCQIYNYNCFSS